MYQKYSWNVEQTSYLKYLSTCDSSVFIVHKFSYHTCFCNQTGTQWMLWKMISNNDEWHEALQGLMAFAILDTKDCDQYPQRISIDLNYFFPYSGVGCIFATS